MLNALIAHGYDRPFAQMLAEHAARAEAEAAPVAIGTVATGISQSCAATVHLDDHRQIILPDGVGLDLGGIAKGWTIQQAAYRLSVWGPCLVDAGGDIACMGEPPTGPWMVGVADPLAPDLDIAFLTVTNQAVATSSRAYRRWDNQGKAAHHLIDPRIGAPADTNILSATVVGRRLPDVEIYAKTALILGESEGLAYLNRLSDVSAILVTDDGRQLMSDSFEESAYVSSGNYADRFRTQA